MMRRRNILHGIISAVEFAVLMMLMPVSCIYDDLPPCPRGAEIQFKYEYNMENADAFSTKVDCICVYVYDEDGKFVTSRKVEGDVLKDKDYRMTLDLVHGNYHMVAYGGMACSQRSFEPVSEPVEGSLLKDLQVGLKHQDHKSEALLHDFYYGSCDFTVEGEMYGDVVLPLVKNTNNIRVMLLQKDEHKIAADDFLFTITDDNALFDCSNGLIAGHGLNYYPWDVGEISTKATKADPADEVCAAFAEFSVSRLMAGHDNRLVITKKKDGEVVLNIPLSSFLLLSKSGRFNDWSSQEYLDRQSDWVLGLYLTEGTIWYETEIIINGWTVRLNNADF